jgi:hypothetical protein
VKSSQRTWYELRWPRDVKPESIEQAMRLLATMAGNPVILEAVGTTGSVLHRLALPPGNATGLVRQLRVAVTGLAVEKLDERPPLLTNRAIEVRLTTRSRSLFTAELAYVSRTLLTTLSDLRADETLSLSWTLGHQLRPLAVPNKATTSASGSWIKDLLRTALFGHFVLDAESRSALKSKQADPGWKAAGRIGVRAEDAPRERQLIRQVLGALRSTEAPGLAYWVRSTRPEKIMDAEVPRRLPLRLNVHEVGAVSSWPVGPTTELPVAHQRSRLLPPSPTIPREGRVIGESTFPGNERSLAISGMDVRRHLWALGPSGVGKSTLLSRLIAQDIAAGRSVVVIEPKSDLIRECLHHIAPERIDDVVLLDPTDAEAPIGFNPLAGGSNPELAADRLLAVFKGLYGSAFGPRTTDIAAAALHTLARVPNMTLAGLPLIISDDGFRRHIVNRLGDHVALAPFWAAFDAWSAAERTSAVAPLLNKTRPFLLRENLRVVIGQSHPRFDMRDVFTKRKILLVDCAKGLLGPEVASLLASLVVSQVWALTLERSGIPAERRHTVCVYLDEFQDYLRISSDLDDALAQARGLGVAFTVANQFAHQLDQSMRSALQANAQNKICFRLSPDDAKLMSSPGSGLAPEDFADLDAYHFYTQLVAHGAVQPWCSGRSLPPDDPISDPEVIKSRSREQHGVSRQTVDNELRSLVFGSRTSSQDDLAPRRRASGGQS